MDVDPLHTIVERKIGRRKAIVSEFVFSAARKQKREFSKELEPFSWELLSVRRDESY